MEHVLSKENKKDSDTWLPSNVGLLRYTACALALGFLLYSYFSYKYMSTLKNFILVQTGMPTYLVSVTRISLKYF